MPVVHSLFREAGNTVIDHERCSGCEQCVTTCPAKVLNLVDGKVEQSDEGFGCIACGHCMMVCPEECIEVTGRGMSAADLMPLLYGELRSLGRVLVNRQPPGQTLQATALVHDAYIRLVDVEKAQHWNSRGHIIGAAAEAMQASIATQVGG